MHTILHLLNSVVDNISRAGVVLSELALLALMVLTSYAVAARYIFMQPSIYSLEISLYLLLIIAWGSAGWVHKIDRHVGMVALKERLRGRWRAAADAISQVTILIFCGVLIWPGLINVIIAFERDYRSASLLSFPLWILFALIPICGTLLGLVALRRLLCVFRSTDQETEQPES